MSDREIMNAKMGLTINGEPVSTRPTPKDMARWLQQTLDIEAEELFGEFGYATLTEEEQRQVLEEVFAKGLIE